VAIPPLTLTLSSGATLMKFGLALPTSAIFMVEFMEFVESAPGLNLT